MECNESHWKPGGMQSFNVPSAPFTQPAAVPAFAHPSFSPLGASGQGSIVTQSQPGFMARQPIKQWLGRSRSDVDGLKVQLERTSRSGFRKKTTYLCIFYIDLLDFHNVSQWKTRSCQVDKFETGKCNLLQLVVSRSWGMVAVCWLKSPPARRIFCGARVSSVLFRHIHKWFVTILFHSNCVWSKIVVPRHMTKSRPFRWTRGAPRAVPRAVRLASRPIWLQFRRLGCSGARTYFRHVCMACGDCKNMLDTDLSGVENNANGRKSGWCRKAC